jgi:hypothetical protein
MGEPSKKGLEQLIQELVLDDEFLTELKEHLEDDDLRGVRVSLLGFLDSQVENEEISAERAGRYYATLGFSPEEASGFRQYEAIRRHSEIKKRLQ